jgi:hypothetical protein
MFILLTCAAADAATRERHRHARVKHAAAHPRLIVCGMTGCFDVPPGCRYEMRRAGRGGVVAVVVCDRK